MLVVEGEWGRVEEITGTFVVIKIWDERRLILPLTYFIEKPFQNWTRHSSQLLGAVFIYADYGMPLAPLRERGRAHREVFARMGRPLLQPARDRRHRAHHADPRAVHRPPLRAWPSTCARNVREGLIDFMQREYPQFLPKMRIESEGTQEQAYAAPAVPTAR